MKNHIQIFLKTLFTCLIASAIVFFIFILNQGGFGIGDFTSFIFWTVIFSIIIGIIGFLFNTILSGLNKFLQYSLFALIGILSGFLFTLIVLSMLGPWFGAFSVPVVVCWIAGGLCSMVIIAGQNTGLTFKHYLLKLSILILICFGLAYGFKPFMIYVSNNQNLTLVAVKWTQSNDSLFIQDSFGNRFNDELKSMLKDSGIRGKLNINSTSTQGEGKIARMFIILNKPVASSVKLLQPDGTSIIYIQEADSFKMFPQDTRTIDRKLELYPDESDNRTVNYWLELAGYGRQGGTFLDWKYDK